MTIHEMTLNLHFLALLIFICVKGIYGQPPSIDEFNVYYGTFHNHSSFSSDATGDPEGAYTYAREVSKLDFFSLSEHCICLTQQEWDSSKVYATRQNRDSSFTALLGFEWTNNSYGHILILNTDSFTSVSKQATDSLNKISDWISNHNGIAFFNHPGRQNGKNTEFEHFTRKPNLNFVGMELWNRNNDFSVYYYNDGYFPNDGNLGFYDEALIRGWKIGASGSEDNHTANWGNYSNFRTAILAKANTRKDITDALLKRHFYSTLDKNIALSFKLNNAQMGDSIHAGKLKLKIEAFDVDNEYFTSITLKKNGTIFKTWSINEQHPIIEDSIWCSHGEYLYAIVTQADGDQAISSPINISYSKPLIIYDTIWINDTTFITDTIYIRDTIRLNQQNKLPFNPSLKIYPNPFNYKISIDLEETQPSIVTIYSSEGYIVLENQYNNKQIQLNTSFLNPGIYLLGLTVNQKTYFQKIIKK